jgi:DNA-binding response OmpR family regulator
MDRRRIMLIVEDHEPTRRTLAKLFAMRGYEVHVASTITEGLKLLAVDPDCLILDLMLPDGEGEDVLRRVRGTGSRTKVAVASGTGDERRLEAVRRLSPDALFRKPICLNDIERICELTHGSN